MNDGLLSQEELDALLAAQAETAGAGQKPDGLPELTPETRDAIGEVGNISLGAGATALSKLVNQTVVITTPRVRVVDRRELERIFPPEQVVVKVEYGEALRGGSLFLLRQADAAVIADLMMGGAGKADGGLDAVRLSAVAEAMNQMMGAAVTAMAGILRERISISPPVVRSVNLSGEEAAGLVEELAGEPLVEACFTLRIADLVESEFIQIMPLEIGKQLVERFYASTMSGVEAAAAATAAPAAAPAGPAPVTAPAPAAADRAGEPPQAAAGFRPGGTDERRGGGNLMGEYGQRNAVVVQPAQFAPLSGQAVVRANPNLQLLLDVPLQVTVELGRTKMMIKDILELAKGSLVELEKFAGEPVDILVNGKLVAKGEVVVIDENFGVKVVDIVTPAERIQGLQ